MKRLLIYLKGYEKECILAPLFKMMEASFELLVPLIIASIIDTGIKNQDKQYVIIMCGLLILLGAVGLVISITSQYFSAKAAVGFATRLRHALYKHLMSLSFTEIDTLGTSTMITRMTSDVNQAQNGVNMVLRLFLRSPFVVLGAMIMAFTIDVKSALLFLIVIIVLSIVVFGIMKINIPMMRKVQRTLESVLLTTRENLAGIRVIRAFGKEEEERKEFRARHEVLTKTQKASGRVSALLNPLTYVFINLGIAALIWTGALQVDAGKLTQGQVVALYSYMSQILVELIKLANLIITVNKAIACGNRVADVFDIQSSMEFPAGLPNEYQQDKEIAVAFDHVSLQYKNAGGETLSNLTFQVKKGETVGIIGGTGSGKTSLVHLIPRFYDATIGNVFVDGKNVKDYTREQLEQKIGIVMQKAVVFSGSMKENLLWGKKNATEQELEDALSIAQAKEVVDQKGGLSGYLTQGGKNLSGGQKQRMTIARALIKQPEILILDDSSSALDYATDARLRAALKRLSYHPTVFMVSQRTASIAHADLILVLEDGKIAGSGTHEELLENCEVYREIYESQFKKRGDK